MPSKKIRYFSAGVNIDEITNARRAAVVAARPPPMKNDSKDNDEDGSEVQAVKNCTCGLDTNHDKPNTPQKPLECLTWTEGQLKKRKRQYSVAWCMSTKACYIPMLERDYKCDVIHELAICGRVSELKAYVRKDPRAVYYRDSAGNTPLMLACAAHGHPFEGVNYLVHRCMPTLIRAENNEGLTALHFAVLNDQPDIVRLLLKKKANVNAGIREIHGIKYGLTPLHLTLIDHGMAEHRRDGCFHILLENGADISVELIEAPRRPADCAVFRYECGCGGCWSSDIGLTSVVPPALIQPVALKRKSRHACLPIGMTSMGPAFNLAVYLNNLWQARSLLLRFPLLNINHTDGYKRSPLFYAVVICNSEMVHLLLANGANVNQSFPLHDRSTVLHLLMSYNIKNANTVFCGWCRGLLHRDDHSFDAVANCLLNSPKLDINKRNKYGQSVLSLAVSNGHVNACKKLLQMGASPLDGDGSGCSLFSLACSVTNPYLRAQVISVLSSTGLGSELFSMDFNSSAGALHTVYQNRDIQTLRTLHATGGISTDNLKQILLLATRELPWVSEEDAKKLDQFRAVLQALLSNPRSLEETCVLYFSSRAGIGTPIHRENALKVFDSENGGAGWKQLVTLMKNHSLL